MSSISGVSTGYYSPISTGKKIQSAADGAAEMAIIEKENAQINGYDMGKRNTEDGKSLVNVADSALNDIADNLNRIRELAIQASNTAALSNEDRQMIQDEVDQLKQGISKIAKDTEFNKKKLLDGSYQDMHIASNPDGSGMDLNIGSSALAELGIEDFDVTGDFNIQDIDNALGKISSTRSTLGAQYNAMDHMSAYNSIASYNLTSSVSNKQDTDIAEAVSELKKQETLQSYQLLMQKKHQEQDTTNKLTIFQM